MNLHEQTTKQMIAILETGVAPWRRPWGDGKFKHKTFQNFTPMFLPQNVKTGRFYQGINIPILWMRGGSPFWGTKKTWEDVGGTVVDDNPIEVFYKGFGRHKVYNLDQVKDCDQYKMKFSINEEGLDFSKADAVVEASGANISPGHSATYYLQEDRISIPNKEEFRSLVGYYTSLFHELIHWTGHPTRLYRTVGYPVGSSEYSEEELVGEMGACFSAASLGFPERLEHMPSHCSYLKHYIDLLKEDNTVLFRICGAASKATTFLLEGQNVVSSAY